MIYIMKKVLITGITGFAGSFLAEHLVQNSEYEISGTFLNEETISNVGNIKDKLDLVKTDLTQKDAVESLITQKKPDMVFHLAAMASVGASFKDPVSTFHNNVDSEIFLLEALRKENLLNTRVLITSSAEVYGYVQPENLPLNENAPLRPGNPYAVTKIAQDFLGLQYTLSYKMPIIRVRPFNHVGPRQAPGFVVSEFAKQIASIEKSQQEPIVKVGNLEAKRDFTDVRDMVKAYTLLMEKGEAGEIYNIGSGISHTIQEILDMLISLSSVQISIETDPARLRPSDIPEIVSDNTKITSLTGWKPEISLEQTLKDTLDYWRNIG